MHSLHVMLPLHEQASVVPPTNLVQPTCVMESDGSCCCSSCLTHATLLPATSPTATAAIARARATVPAWLAAAAAGRFSQVTWKSWMYLASNAASQYAK